MKTYYSLLLTLCIALYSCTLDHIPPVTGNIEGYVVLYGLIESQSYRANLDHSGVNVRLDGIDPAIEVLTDKDGHWVMKDVPAGTYTVTYSKAGFNNYKIFGVQHTGGKTSTFPYLDDSQYSVNRDLGIPYVADKLALYELIRTQVLDFVGLGLVKPVVFDSAYQFQASFSNESVSREGLCYFSNDGEATPTHYDYITRIIIPARSETVKFQQTLIALQRVGYKTGDLVSAKVHAVGNFTSANSSTLYSYYDPTIDTRIYTNISKAGLEVKFTMP